MATESRRTDPPLAQELLDEPYRFEFFQAVRLLERMYPDRHPVGREPDAANEVVRFRTRQTLSFPPCEIYDLTQDGNEKRAPEMTVWDVDCRPSSETLSQMTSSKSVKS